MRWLAVLLLIALPVQAEVIFDAGHAWHWQYEDLLRQFRPRTTLDSEGQPVPIPETPLTEQWHRLTDEMQNAQTVKDRLFAIWRASAPVHIDGAVWLQALGAADAARQFYFEARLRVERRMRDAGEAVPGEQ
jgi:hypothetical protein